MASLRLAYPWLQLKETAAVVREKIARVRNAIEALARQFIPIYPLTIMDVYEVRYPLSLPLPIKPRYSAISPILHQAGLAYPAKDMLKPAVIEKITARAQQREGIL